MFTDNLLLSTDSYKVSMWKQYPQGTQHIYSYIESRGGKWPRTLFFGLQAYLKEYLSHPITRENVEEAATFYAAHGEPFFRDGWEHVLNAHSGFLPVRIKSLPEGLVIDTHNVLATVENTDPLCSWLTTYLETSILRGIWFPTTVATNSFHCKLAILNALNKSSDGDPMEQVAFKLHDFSARGTSAGESAALGGMAHLVNFKGSDTVEGVIAARRYYGEEMAGFSISASEHSTMTVWGQEHETEAYANMLRQFARPGSVLAVVSDSYDLMNAVRNIWGGTLKQSIINSGAIVVVRPDSGDPLVIPVQVIRVLSEKFGFSVNSKGYKVLPPCVRVIQGDGITSDTLPAILDNLLAAGFSADNIAFGMGSGLTQQLNRDTQKFAMKCSAASVDGVWRDVYKAPVTDPTKRSKRGRLALIRTDSGKVATVPLLGNEDRDMLEVVFENGKMIRTTTFSEVRQRAAAAALM